MPYEKYNRKTPFISYVFSDNNFVRKKLNHLLVIKLSLG